jgi:hypothetical protein
LESSSASSIVLSGPGFLSHADADAAGCCSGTNASVWTPAPVTTGLDETQSVRADAELAPAFAGE